jgi:hypothetical protein
MREETTVKLISHHSVRIGKDLPHLQDMIKSETTSDDMRANLISYILVCSFNFYFAFRDAGTYEMALAHRMSYLERGKK